MGVCSPQAQREWLQELLRVPYIPRATFGVRPGMGDTGTDPPSLFCTRQVVLLSHRFPTLGSVVVSMVTVSPGWVALRPPPCHSRCSRGVRAPAWSLPCPVAQGQQPPMAGTLDSTTATHRNAASPLQNPPLQHPPAPWPPGQKHPRHKEPRDKRSLDSGA